jgi:hypothetical protein
MLEVVRNASLFALASTLLGVLPLTTGIVYAIWPTEQRLALMRPLSLVTIFAALSGTSLGFINVLRGMGIKRSGFDHVFAIGSAEALVPFFVGFGCLTGAWLCVTIGLWRRP